MTLTQFLSIYQFKFKGLQLDNTSYEAITEVIRLSDTSIVDSVKTIFNINDITSVR